MANLLQTVYGTRPNFEQGAGTFFAQWTKDVAAWSPAFQFQRSGQRPPPAPKKLDVFRSLERPQDPPPWFKVWDALAAQWAPAFRFERESFLPPAKRKLDLWRQLERPQEPPPWFKIWDALAAQWSPAFRFERESFLPPARKLLSTLRHLDDLSDIPSQAKAADLQAAMQFPAIGFSAASYLTRRPPDIDLWRQLERPQDGWLFSSVPVAFNPVLWPALELMWRMTGEPTPRLDLFRHLKTWDVDWVKGTDQQIAAQMAALSFAAGSFLAPHRPELDVRELFERWAFGAVVPLTADQVWPALSFALAAFRAGAPKSLDLFRHLKTWDVDWVGGTDQQTAAQSAAIGFSAASFLSRRPPQLDLLRQLEHPQDGWLFSSVPVTYNAALWPALELMWRMTPPTERLDLLKHLEAPQQGWLGTTAGEDVDLWMAAIRLFESVRMPAGRRLDVLRNLDRPSDLAWMFQEESAAFGQWASAFGFQAASFLFKQRPLLDLLRSLEVPQGGWIGTAGGADASAWLAAIRNLESYRARSRTILDLGRQLDRWNNDWQRGTDAQIASQMPSVLFSQASFRTSSRAPLDPSRMLERQQETPWVYQAASDDFSRWQSAIRAFESFRMPMGMRLDILRNLDRPSDVGWMFQEESIDFERWSAAMDFQAASFLSKRPQILDLLRNLERPQEGWIGTAGGADAGAWMAAARSLESFRLRDQLRFDLWRHLKTWDTDWSFGADQQTAAQMAALLFETGSFLAPRQPGLDVRGWRNDEAWIGGLFAETAMDQFLAAIETYGPRIGPGPSRDIRWDAAWIWNGSEFIPPTTVFRRTLSQYGTRTGGRQVLWELLVTLGLLGL